MTRNILGQACYQLAVMMVLIFTGDRWIPETSYAPYKEHEGKDGYTQFSSYGDGRSYVVSGRRFVPFSTVEEYKHSWEVVSVMLQNVQL